AGAGGLWVPGCGLSQGVKAKKRPPRKTASFPNAEFLVDAARGNGVDHAAALRVGHRPASVEAVTRSNGDAVTVVRHVPRRGVQRVEVGSVRAVVVDGVDFLRRGDAAGARLGG